MAISKKKVIMFVMSFLVLLLVIAPTVTYFVMNKHASSQVEEFTENFKDICSIQYGKISYNILNRHLKVNDINIVCNNEQTATIDEVVFNHIVSGTPVPLNVQANIKHALIHTNSKIFQPYGEYIAYFGYDKINFQGTITYTLGKVSKDFKIVGFDIIAHNIGNFTGQLKVPDVYAENIKVIYDNILNNKQASFYVDFNDKGFKYSLITKYTNMAGIENNKVIEKIQNAIYKRAVNSDNRAKENYTQLEKFLVSSNSISMTLSENDNKSITDTIHSFDMTGYRKMLGSIKNAEVDLIVK